MNRKADKAIRKSKQRPLEGIATAAAAHVKHPVILACPLNPFFWNS
jgi:hypothetical protein